MDSLQCNTVEVVMQGWAVPLPRCALGGWAAGVGVVQSEDPGARRCGLVGNHTLVAEFLHLTSISRTPTMCLVQGQKGLCRPGGVLYPVCTGAPLRGFQQEAHGQRPLS